MRKTLDEIKDEVARSYGHTCWAAVKNKFRQDSLDVSGLIAFVDLANEIFYLRNHNNRQERILCSAVHFNDGNIYEQNDEREAQPIGIEIGFIAAGRRHSDCYTSMSILNPNLLFTRANSLSGFLTNTNKFVSRAEGFEIAKAADQLLMPNLYDDKEKNILTSECLY